MRFLHLISDIFDGVRLAAGAMLALAAASFALAAISWASLVNDGSTPHGVRPSE